MKKIFTELKPLGLSDAKVNEDTLFDTGKPSDGKKVSDPELAAKETVEAKEYEKDSLFDKQYTCPICDNKFKERTMRTGRTRLISTDTDLRRKFKAFDPIKYDIIACPKCGYAAMGQKSFEGLSSLQRKLLREQVQANFKGLPPMGELYSYDEAIIRYKLALYSSIVKKSRASERAYMCLKIAWLYRSKKEDMDASDKKYEEKQKECQEEENSYIEKAFHGFDAAAQSEMFPICGMDEMAFNYLYSDLARRIGKLDVAKKMLGSVLVSKTASSSLKNKARTLKELIREEEAKKNE